MIADAVEHMLAAGMSNEAVVAAIRAMEASEDRPLTLRQARNRRYYRRLKSSESSESSNKTEATSKEAPHTPQEIYNIYTPLEAKASISPKPKKGTRLPENWHPSEALWSFGETELGLPPDLLRFETSAFRDFFWSSPKGVKVDWDRTWKNWMREAVRRRGKGSGPPRPKFSPSMEAMTRLTKEMQERENGFSSNVIDIARQG